MDALLRYALYQIAFSLLLLEVAIMVICCFLIIIIKFFSRRIRNKREKDQEKILELIDSYLLNDKPLDDFTIPKDLRNFRNLVESLEKYDHLFVDDRWQQIKNKIAVDYLFPQVESQAASFFWFKRQMAARAILLAPQKAPVDVMEKLLNDPRYLVSVTAATAALKIADKRLFFKVVKKMSTVNSHSQFPYRDALMQVDSEKYYWLEELLKSTTDKKEQAICLDILGSRYTKNTLSTIEPFINDPDKNCRNAAINALSNLPSEESIALLVDRLHDSDWQMRADAIKALNKLHAKETMHTLIPLLHDPVWWVRLQAALTIKSFGNEGLKVLSTISKEKEPTAHQIAQYILAMP